jgi:flagellar biosynthesis/type III secretory pathway chaperone
MFRERPEQLARRVTEVLKAESAALAAGDYGALDRIGDRRDKLIARLERMVDPADSDAMKDALAELRHAADRNGVLLQAALRGIAEAKRMVAEAQAGRRRLGVYNPTGERLDQTPGQSELERKL